jgi:hypothetical protein
MGKSGSIELDILGTLNLEAENYVYKRLLKKI